MRQMRSEADGQRIPVRFIEMIQNVLVVLIAVRIFNRRIHIREDSQIVKDFCMFVCASGESGSPGFSVDVRSTKLWRVS